MAVVLLLALGQAAAAPLPAAAPSTPQSAPAAQRFLVRLRSAYGTAGYAAAPERVSALAARHGLAPTEARHIAAGLHLLRIEAPAGRSTTQTLAALRGDPQVAYADIDQRRHALRTPDDSDFTQQWYLQNSQPAALNAVGAWDVTTGSLGVVIADLDTGVLFNHPDLRNNSANRLLPGYDMISNGAVANDGGGRDADASDPGDWVTAADAKTSQFSGCTVGNSSWHGTRVAGILGAITDNSQGVAGLSWQGWIEPVRVLGKCGGYDSDIIAAMYWAAGLPVSGVPANPYPAQIINMSLGSADSSCTPTSVNVCCPQSYQSVVDDLIGAGVLVVAAAGNEGGPVDTPADCAGVAAVAGLRHIGTKVGYSSLGPEIALSAPAGNCVNTGGGQPCLFSIVTTTNTGTTVPATNTYTDEYNFNVGTSFSAPIVAGIAGLMLAVNGNLTPDQIVRRLQKSAQAFPVNPTAQGGTCHVPVSPSDLQTAECNCTNQTCGAGMANANDAVAEALRPIAAVSVVGAVQAGNPVTLDASGSAAACQASIASYAWTVTQPSSNPPPIQNASSARASIVAPTAPATYTLQLTVTDNQGRADTATVVLSSTAMQSTAPAAAGTNACLAAVAYSVPPPNSGSGAAGGSGGHGGGGGLDPLSLLGLAAGLLTCRARAQRGFPGAPLPPFRA
ncbi:MAG: S8 family serine peptidase [Gammaproteobacteria bacterium]|nr:S8 family serine peptidase [Gammaproteobacteria bacterium]